MKRGKISHSLLLAAILAVLMISIPASLAFAQTISIAPTTTGTVGTPITVTGTGFTPAQAFTTRFETTSEPGGTVAGDGTIRTVFTVPAYPRGPHTVTVTTAADGSASATFNITPDISLSDTSGSVGDQLSVSGTGFKASSTVNIYFDGQSVKSNVITDGNGSFTGISFIVPQTTPGDHQVTAADAVGYAQPVTFSVVIEIDLSPATATVGSRVTVTGRGFATSSSVSFNLDGVAVPSATTRTSSNGSFTYGFVVPPAVGGDHTLEAVDDSDNSATADLTVVPSIALNPPSGSAGVSVSVTGSGFSASQTVTLRYNAARVSTSPPVVATDSNGSFRAAFVVPESTSGSYTLEASDGTYSATASLLIVASASVNPMRGGVATAVTVKGAGFSSRGTVTVKYDGNQVAQVTADDNGAFSTTFNVPNSPGGNHVITISDGIDTATSTFTIVAAVSLNPASGFVGGDVLASGTGFMANSTVTIRYDANQVATATSDASGTFSATFKAPASKGGNHTVTATDSANTATFVFAMDSTAPPAPSPVSPQDGARLSITGNIRPTLRWSSVADPSGVTYVLEVDTNPDFSSPILEKASISANHYTLVAAEALPEGRYYWRVRVVDGASNESAWSQPFLLKSGLMPPWALVLIIVLAAVAVGVALYFLVASRRRAAVPVPAGLPQAIPGQWRLIEPEETASRPSALPWRLALPQAPKKARTLSTEQQARLNVIVDFAQSLPLVEVGYSADWLVDLVESSTGIEASPEVYEQLLKGELPLRYEPAWMRHPTYRDLTEMLEGQSLPGDLNAFVDAVNRCASEAMSLLRDIYHDAAAEIPSDFLARGGWKFISGVYSDAMSWYLGKSLRDPSDRDYATKPLVSGEDTGALSLWGDETTSFGGPLIQAADEKEASQFRALHLKLRRAYRSSDKARQLVGMMSQLDVQRGRLLSVLSQFRHPDA